MVIAITQDLSITPKLCLKHLNELVSTGPNSNLGPFASWKSFVDAFSHLHTEWKHQLQEKFEKKECPRIYYELKSLLDQDFMGLVQEEVSLPQKCVLLGKPNTSSL